MAIEEQSRADKQGGSPAAGDAGKDFLNSLPPDVTNKAEVTAFNEGAHQLKDLAGKGGFAINEAGMREYLKLCDMYLDGYAARAYSLHQLTDRAKLGSSPYAYAIADHNIKVANGDEHSLIPNLNLMKDGYEQLKEAFQIARKNYRETEAEHDQVFRKINPE